MLEGTLDFNFTFSHSNYIFKNRVFLATVLKSQPNIKVTCIVRAVDTSSAFTRIKNALEEAGYWNDSYASSIIVFNYIKNSLLLSIYIIAVAGDLTKEQFGLTTNDFAQLCKSVHSVFHFAASTSLVDPYDLIRHDNTLVMRTLMIVCASGATKPLHHVSTLAIFPEYISGFPSTCP